jgi:hypothetical protein
MDNATPADSANAYAATPPWAFGAEMLSLPLPCPDCGRETCDLRHYTTHDVTFFVVGVRRQDVVSTACPACARWHLVRHLLTQLVRANLLWPVLTLVPNLVSLLATFRKGHTQAVREACRHELAEARLAASRGYHWVPPSTPVVRRPRSAGPEASARKASPPIVAGTLLPQHVVPARSA